MATLSSILAWEISWTEEPSRPQPMGSQRVGHNLMTKQQQIIQNGILFCYSPVAFSNHTKKIALCMHQIHNLTFKLSTS